MVWMWYTKMDDWEITKIVYGNRYRLPYKKWCEIVAESFAEAYDIPLKSAESILVNFSMGLNGEEFEELVEWHLEDYIDNKIQEYRVDY